MIRTRVFQTLLVVVSALSVSAIGRNVSVQSLKAGEAFPRLKVDKLIVMPREQGHDDWINAIKNAQHTLHMTMYHLTDKEVIDALVSRVGDKSLDMRVIVDGKLTGGYKKAFDSIKEAGVNIRASSSFFTITHAKAMVLDGQSVFITAINMTNTARTSRDFGIVTSDENAIAETEKVFEADWQNAQSSGGTTPSLEDPNLAWSPNNSDQQLVKLVDTASQTLDIEVENLGSDDILAAFARAASRGVNVRLIVPECVLGNGLFNYQFFAKLPGVNIHVEPNGNSMEQPYMHSKMMVADGKYIYVGSINYSFNSTMKARELGAIFLDEGTAKTIESEYEIDWNRSHKPDPNPSCGKQTEEEHDTAI